MNTLRVILLFASMYAALVIIAELIYMFLDDLVFTWKCRKREKQNEEELQKIIFGKPLRRMRR